MEMKTQKQIFSNFATSPMSKWGAPSAPGTSLLHLRVCHRIVADSGCRGNPHRFMPENRFATCTLKLSVKGNTVQIPPWSIEELKEWHLATCPKFRVTRTKAWYQGPVRPPCELATMAPQDVKHTPQNSQFASNPWWKHLLFLKPSILSHCLECQHWHPWVSLSPYD